MSLQTRLTALATAIGADIKSIRDSIISVPMDTWHVVGAVGEPAFGTNMVVGNLGGLEGDPSQATTAFRKLPTGVVEFRGAVQLTAGGTGTATAFTLPVGYRPPAMIILDAFGSTGGGNPPQQVKIWPDGKVKVPGGVGTYLLDGLVFDTETVSNMFGTKGDKGDKGDTGANGNNLAVAAASIALASGVPVNIAGGWKNLPIPALTTIDPADGFTIVAGAVQVKDAGWYSVESGIFINAGAANQIYGSISTSPVPGDGTVANSSNPPDAYNRVNLSGSIKLAAGDKIYVHANSGSASPVNAQLQNFSISKIGGPSGAIGPAGPAGGNATVPMDPWHYVGTAGEPAFSAGWSNYGGSYGTVGFRKDPLGRVHLRGLVQTPAAPAIGATIFTLPAGYLPPIGRQAVLDTSYNAVGVCRIDVGTDGIVKFMQSDTAITAGGFITFDSLYFDTDTVTQMPTGPMGPTGPGGSVLVQDEGSLLAVRAKLNLVGANIRAVDDAANDRINIIHDIPLVTTGSLSAGQGGIPNPIPDGFMIRFRTPYLTTFGTQWFFIYEADATETIYKWRFLGGGQISKLVGGESCNFPDYRDLPTIQNVLPPLAGEYEIEWGADAYSNAIGYAYVGVYQATVFAMEAAVAIPWVNGQVPINKKWSLTVTAGQDIRLKFKLSAGAGGFPMRYLYMKPIRVI